MYYFRLVVACAAMLLSWLCFDSVGADDMNYIAAEEKATAVQMEIDLETLPENTQQAVLEVTAEGVMYTPMAGYCSDMAVQQTDGCSAQAESGPACDAVMGEDVSDADGDAPYVLIRTEERRREEERQRIAAEKAAEERRIAAEKAAREAEKRRIAAEKAAKEAALRAACPGYDEEFVATLTKEEQAEARWFYEQGYVFYRQNWSSVKDAEYGDCGFGQCGCGPTCVAAIISNLAGVPVDPEEMRVYGLSVGSWLSTGGTTYGFLIETAKKYGISATQIYAGDKNALFAALKDENKLVLATMGPGDFTLGAHFMLFRGMTDEGKILIADSYSFEHSVKEWDYDVLYAQLKTGYWIFEKTN